MNKLTKAGLAGVLLLIIIALYFWQAASRSPKATVPAGPPEKITISTLPIYPAALLFIAQEKGYFRDNGLEVDIQPVETGRICLDYLLAGRVDIAFMADFVILEEILKGSTSLRILGSPAAVDFIHLLALKDHGIIQPSDLKGKRVGVARSTVAEFFLGRFLTFNDLSLNDVKVTYLNPSEMAAALANNRVDAVMVWTPVTYEIKRQLGEKIVSWPGQVGQKFYEVLVSTDEFIKAKSEVLERLFRALAQAETFLKHNQDESQAIIAKWLKIEPDVFKADWVNSEYRLSFDQGLLISMEDQARWMIRNKLVQQTKVPDLLDYFQVEPLARVVPKAVRIIIPKRVSTGAPGQSESGKER